MRTINNIVCKRIISEPGDMTRYDYILINDYDEYMIMPYKSGFRFPQRINYYNINNINTFCVS